MNVKVIVKVFCLLLAASCLLLPASVRAWEPDDDVIYFLDMHTITDTGVCGSTGDCADIGGAWHYDDGGLVVETGTKNEVVNPIDGYNSWSCDAATTSSDYTADVYVGDTCIKSESTASTYIYIYRIITLAGLATGQTWTFSAYVKPDANLLGETLQVRIQERGGAAVPEIHYENFTLAAGWNHYTVSAALTENDRTSLATFVLVYTPSAAGQYVLIDGAQLEANTNTSLAHGDGGPGYSWTGSPHASASERLTTTVGMPDLATALSNNDTWSLRLQHVPQYNATADWPSNATLFDSDNVRIQFDDVSNSYLVDLDGTTVITSATQTFVAGGDQDIALTMDYTNDVYTLYTNDAAEIVYTGTHTSTTWTTATLGSTITGTQHSNATYSEIAAVDVVWTRDEFLALIGSPTTSAASDPVTSVDLLEGLTAYWDMDENGGVRYDAHASYDLTDNNTVLTDTGILDLAAAFVSANSETLGVADAVGLRNQGTIAGWVKLDTTQQATILAYKLGEWYLWYDVNLGFMYDVVGSGGTRSITAPGDYITNTWHFIAGVHDDANSTLTLWVDDIAHTIDYAGGQVADAYALTFGTDLDGALDAVGLWDRNLRASEITALYNDGNGRAYSELGQIGIYEPPPERQSGLGAGLLAHWPLDEASGTRYDIHGGYNLSATEDPESEDGIINDAVDLDGDEQYLNGTNPISGTFTLAAWVRAEQYCTTATECPVIAAWDVDHEWRLRYYTNYFYADFQTSSGLQTASIPLYPTIPGGWHLVGMGYNAATSECILRVDTQSSAIKCSDAITSGASSFMIGTDGSEYFDGQVDHVFAWDTYLSDSEWSTIYNYGDGLPYAEIFTTPGDLANSVFLPFIAHNWPAADTTIRFPTPTPESPFVDLDYSGDTSWTEWAKVLEGFFTPLFENIDAAEGGLNDLRGDICGAGFSGDSGFLAGHDYDTPIEEDLGEDPSILEVSYVFGIALGRPFGWVKALYSWLPSIQSSYNVVGLNFFVMLVYATTAGIGWISFVVIVTYSMYFIRTVIDLAIQIYELIPMKAT